MYTCPIDDTDFTLKLRSIRGVTGIFAWKRLPKKGILESFKNGFISRFHASCQVSQKAVLVDFK